MRPPGNFQIAADGSFHTATKLGGWAATITSHAPLEVPAEAAPLILKGAVPKTKSSYMEIKAATVALEALPRKSKARVKTDYQTICDAAEDLEKERFINRKDGKAYERFYKAIKRHEEVIFEKVTAHTGDADNEAVDTLAKMAVREGGVRFKIPVPIDFGLIPKGQPRPMDGMSFVV